MYKYWIVFGVVYSITAVVLLFIGSGLLSLIVGDFIPSCLASRDFVLHHHRLPDSREQFRLAVGSVIVAMLIEIVAGSLFQDLSDAPEGISVLFIVIFFLVALGLRGVVIYASYGWGARRTFDSLR